MTKRSRAAAVLATRGRFYAVADGMGGHQAGQIASELALKTVLRSYYSDAGMPGDARGDVGAALTRAVGEANRYLLDVARMIPERSGMGTTLTAAVVREDELFLAQVGDSRCYLLRDDRMEQITEDHSWVQEQVSRGVMSLEEAAVSKPALVSEHLEPGVELRGRAPEEEVAQPGPEPHLLPGRGQGILDRA